MILLAVIIAAKYYTFKQYNPKTTREVSYIGMQEETYGSVERNELTKLRVAAVKTTIKPHS